jgi:thioesterase domain-containing protein
LTDYRPVLTDIGEEILALFDRRRREAREQAQREQILARDLAIRQTMKELLERREAKAQERARKEAQREAEELAEKRRKIEERAEEHAAALAQDLRDLEEVHVRHRAKLHEAGTPVSAHYRLADILTPWFRYRFGGHHTLIGILAPHHAREDRTLPERDPLAPARTEWTTEEAS